MKYNYRKISLWFVCLIALATMGAKFQTNIMKFGRNTAENLTIEFDIGASQNPKIFWNNATSKLRFTNNGTTFFDLGSGSGGGGGSGVNLVTNPGYEEGIGTTFTYKDAAAVSPVDGTGGSPTLTAAITTTGGEVLRGLQSLKITKPASNTQGEGVSIPVTIEELDKGKLLQLSFDFKTQGNYAANDFRVYLIETSGPTVITPIQYQVPLGSGTFKTAVMTNTLSSYRIVVHCATTSTSTSSFIIDNVSLGPNNIPTAPAVASSVPFTATGSWVTNTTYSASYTRVGRIAYIHYDITTSGAPNAVDLQVNLPPGLTADMGHPGYNFSPYAHKFGSGIASDSASSVSTDIIVSYNSGFTIDTGNPLSAPVSYINPFTFGAGDTVSIDIEVPIAQWTENSFLENTGIEYVCNTSLTDADDTSSFSSNSGGCQFANMTTVRRKRIRWNRAKTPGDVYYIETSVNGGASFQKLGGIVVGGTSTFVPFEDRGSAAQAGIGMEEINATDIDVYFGVGPSFGNTYQSTSSWSSFDNDPQYLWRVVKASSVNSVGHDVVGQDKPGLVNGAGQLRGTATNDNACVGCVGEVIESVIIDSSAVSAASITDLTSIVLTPGDWLVQAHCLFSGNASIVLYTCGVSDVSAAYAGDIAISRAYSTAAIATGQGHTIDHWRRYKVATGTTKTVYNVIDGNFTGTLQASGSLTAQRVR